MKRVAYKKSQLKIVEIKTRNESIQKNCKLGIDLAMKKRESSKTCSKTVEKNMVCQLPILQERIL